MAKHAALPEEITPETTEAERKAKRWHDMNGTTVPEWGRRREPQPGDGQEQDAA